MRCRDGRTLTVAGDHGQSMPESAALMAKQQNISNARGAQPPSWRHIGGHQLCRTEANGTPQHGWRQLSQDAVGSACLKGRSNDGKTLTMPDGHSLSNPEANWRPPTFESPQRSRRQVSGAWGVRAAGRQLQAQLGRCAPSKPPSMRGTASQPVPRLGLARAAQAAAVAQWQPIADDIGQSRPVGP